MTNKPMLSVELLTCPFCGSNPTLPDGYGTQYEIECDGCGKATSSVQICDLMTLEERSDDEFKDYRYGEEFIERAKLVAIDGWNNRVNPAAQHQGDPVTDDQLIEIARKAALNSTHRYSYMPAIQEDANSWSPHRWVIEAMRAALKMAKEGKGS